MNKSEIKPIILRDEETGKTYTLRFTRATIAKMERNGFIANEITAFPMTRVPEMFHGAFLADQPYITRKETDEILYDKLGGMSDVLMERLGELYQEPISTLMEDKGDNTGNPRKMTVEL